MLFGNGASVGVRKGSGWETAAPCRQKTPCRAEPRFRQAEGSWAGPLAVLRDQEQAAQTTKLSLQEQMPYLEDELRLLKDQGSATNLERLVAELEEGRGSPGPRLCSSYIYLRSERKYTDPSRALLAEGVKVSMHPGRLSTIRFTFLALIFKERCPGSSLLGIW